MVTNKSKKISVKPCAILESLTPEIIKGPGLTLVLTLTLT